jgi:hypothetical protein
MPNIWRVRMRSGAPGVDHALPVFQEDLDHASAPRWWGSHRRGLPWDGRDLDRHEGRIGIAKSAFAGQPAPGEDDAGRETMAAGHFGHRHARLQRLFHNLEFALEVPAPPALRAENFDLHRPADLKASLKVRTSRANSALTRGRTPSAYKPAFGSDDRGPRTRRTGNSHRECGCEALMRGSGSGDECRFCAASGGFRTCDHAVSTASLEARI